MKFNYDFNQCSTHFKIMRNTIDYFNELTSDNKILQYYRFVFKYFKVIGDTSG